LEARIAFAGMVSELTRTNTAGCRFPDFFSGIGVFSDLLEWLEDEHFTLKAAAARAVTDAFPELSEEAAVALVHAGLLPRLARVIPAMGDPHWAIETVLRALGIISKLDEGVKWRMVREIAECGLLREIEAVEEAVGDDFDADTIAAVLGLWAELAPDWETGDL
jgi:hypothetical protein